MKRLLALSALVLLGCEHRDSPVVAYPPGKVQPPAVMPPPVATQPPPAIQPPSIVPAPAAEKPANNATSPLTLDTSSDEALRRSWQALVSGSEEEKRQVNFGIQLLAHRGMKEARFEGMQNIPLFRALEFAHGMTKEKILEATAAERATLDSQSRQ